MMDTSQPTSASKSRWPSSATTQRTRSPLTRWTCTRPSTRMTSAGPRRITSWPRISATLLPLPYLPGAELKALENSISEKRSSWAKVRGDTSEKSRHSLGPSLLCSLQMAAISGSPMAPKATGALSAMSGQAQRQDALSVQYCDRDLGNLGQVLASNHIHKHHLHFAVHQRTGLRVMVCSRCDAYATLAPKHLLEACVQRDRTPNWDRLSSGRFPNNRFGHSRVFCGPFRADPKAIIGTRWESSNIFFKT